MTHYGVCPLVCPLNIWPGQGFYVELFLIVASPSGYLSKQKRVFSWCFHWKNIQLDALLHNFRGLQKKSSINLCIFNFIKFPLILYWERRSFPWLLVALYLYKPGSPPLPGGRGSQRHFRLFAYDLNLGLSWTKSSVNISRYILILLIAVNVVTKITHVVFQRAIMLNKSQKIHVNSFKTLDSRPQD